MAKLGYVTCIVAVGVTGVWGFQALGQTLRQDLVGLAEATPLAATNATSGPNQIPSVGTSSLAGVATSFARNLERLGQQAAEFSRRMSTAADRVIDAHYAGDADALTLARIERETIRAEVAAKAVERDSIAFETIIRSNEMWGTSEKEVRFNRARLAENAWNSFLDDVADPDHPASLKPLLEAQRRSVIGGAEAFLRRHRAQRYDAVRSLEFGDATDSKLSQSFQSRLPGIAVRFTPSDAKADPVVARFRHTGPDRSVFVDLVGSAAEANKLNDARLKRLVVLHQTFAEELVKRKIDLVVDLWEGAEDLQIGRDRVGTFVAIGIDHPTLVEAAMDGIARATDL